MTEPTAIDPEIHVFVDGIAAAYARFPDVMTIPTAEGRRVVEEVRRPWREAGPRMAEMRERAIDLAHGPMCVRIHYPTAEGGGPALVYLHGGGFTFCSIDTHDRVMREYAERTGFVVVGADYPLSPEAKFPVALEQVAGLVEWLANNAAEVGIDPGRIAIGGDSAGGNLSLAAALLLRSRGRGDLIKGLVLNYPALTPESSDETIRRFGGPGAILTADEMAFFWDNYLRGPEDRRDPLADTMLADLRDLPPAIFIVAEIDLLAEQSPAMAERMRAAGGDATVRSYPGAVHGFIEAVAVSRLAAQGLHDAAEWLVAVVGAQRAEAAAAG